jgi:alpha-1,3-rhamnosyl/mannosyltransferase
MLVRSAGVKTYLHHWVSALRTLHPELIQTFLEPRGTGLRHIDGVWQHPGKLIALQALKWAPGLAVQALSPRCSVFHASNLLGSRLPIALTRRTLLSATIHDMTAWLVPGCHLPEQVRADKDFARSVIVRADGLIAVSETTRNDAIRILDVSPERIQVVYPGVTSEYFRVTPQQSVLAAETFGLSSPYFLFVGTIEPRKNVDTLLSAWMSMPASFRLENTLVLIGMPGWKSGTTIARLHDLTREHEGIRYLGYVPEQFMPGLIHGAQALLCPSYYEGFGFPAAQAMAAGCPVIAANAGSLPEITSGSSLLVDPYSTAELVAAIRRIHDSPALSQCMRVAGRQIAEKYSWQESASKSYAWLSSLRR